MNERIKELLEEATEVYDHWHSGESHSVVDYKVFAELLLKDCFQCIENEEDRLWNLSLQEGIPKHYQSDFEICADKCRDIRQVLKDHFGVEE